jgi:hypothetical protein
VTLEWFPRMDARATLDHWRTDLQRATLRMY